MPLTKLTSGILFDFNEKFFHHLFVCIINKSMLLDWWILYLIFLLCLMHAGEGAAMTNQSKYLLHLHLPLIIYLLLC